MHVRHRSRGCTFGDENLTNFCQQIDVADALVEPAVVFEAIPSPIDVANDVVDVSERAVADDAAAVAEPAAADVVAKAEVGVAEVADTVAESWSRWRRGFN